MTDHQVMIRAIEEAVDKAVTKTVNGKLAALDLKLTERLDDQDKAIAPVIRAFTGGTGLINAALGLLKILALLGTAGAGWLIISNLWHKP